VFEHFTESACRVLVLAQEEPQHLHDSSVDPAHLLLGMLREGGGIAAKALLDIGVDYYGVREVIKDDHDQRAGLGSGPKPLSAATLRIIERSVQISWTQAAGGIGTEHLLVALLEEQDETIEVVLAALDVTPQEVVLRVNALLAD
jgi:ATP-dependent Clp protease ATP-binding subunit ClpC